MQQHYQQLHAAGRLPSASAATAATAAAVSCAAAGWSVPSTEGMRHNLAQVQMHLQHAAQQQAAMQAQMSQAQLRGQMHAQMHAQFQAQQAGVQRAPAWSSEFIPVTSLEPPPTGAPRAEAAPSRSSAQAPATAALAPLPASLSEAGWSRPAEGALAPGAIEQVRGVGGENRGGGAVGEGFGEGSGEGLGEGLGEAVGEAVSAQVSAQVSAILLMPIGHRTHHLARTHSPGSPPTRHAAISATISPISSTISPISSPKDKQHAPCAASGAQRPCDAGGAAAECSVLGGAGGAAEGAGGGGGGEAAGPMQAAMQAFGGGAAVYFPEAIDAPVEEVATP